jgi:hypothetical protein
MPDSVLWWKNSNFLYGDSLYIVSSTEAPLKQCKALKKSSLKNPPIFFEKILRK